jgi:hypothetical protein
MTLRVERGPRGGLGLLIRSLADQSRNKKSSTNHSVKIAKPIPLWSMNGPRNDSSSLAELFGWRYLIIDTKKLLWIDINRHSNRLSFASQVVAGDSNLLRSAIFMLSQTELASNDPIYNVRILYTGTNRRWGLWLSAADSAGQSYFANLNSADCLEPIDRIGLPPEKSNDHEIGSIPSRLSGW